MNSRNAYFCVLMAAVVAIALPTIIGHSTSPNSTFFNQIFGYIGWGAFGLTVLAVVPVVQDGDGLSTSSSAAGPSWGHASVLVLLAILMACALNSHGVNGLPWGLTLQPMGVLMAAALVFVLGLWCASQASRIQCMTAVCVGVAVAGVLGWLIGALQVFHPQWTDGDWLARAAVAGRAVGNLRQPNHLSTLLLWAAAALVALGSDRPRHAGGWAAAGIWLMCVGVVWTASRTGGWLGIALLCLWGAWGLWKRRLPVWMGVALLACPLVYLGAWGGMWWLQHHWGVAFASEARLHDHSDISSSRFAIWSNTLAINRMNPWTGVGFGEFNLAWTLTPFAHRPPEFFDHTHNIVLQFIVEEGVPLGLLLTALLCFAGFDLCRRVLSRDSVGTDAQSQAGLYIVLMACVHSLLEYPLWYTYFLLPTAFFWGYGLVHRASTLRPAPRLAKKDMPGSRSWGAAMLMAGCVFVAASGVWAISGYMLAENVYENHGHDDPLDVRIARAQGNVLYAYQGSYAQATTENDAAVVLQAIHDPLHNLIDARLLVAYARALGEAGETDKAWYVADRLREFHHSLGDDFFAECDDYGPMDAQRPFQCLPRVPARQPLSFEDFRH